MNRRTLPIDAALPNVLDAIRLHRRVVLIAPPGAGKTSRLPPALVGSGILAPQHPNVVVLQPRRVAARSVAARIADENSWTLGEEVGYQVRFERKIRPKTRLRVITEGILNRQVVADPFLEGVGAVVLDEFHERSLHTDLALAFLKEVRESVREDLILVVMSATMDAGPVAAFLGDAPIVRVEGRAFPVEITHRGNDGSALPDRMARAIAEAIEASPDRGDVLAFLPGVEEIRRTARQLGPLADRHGLLVLPLHGSLPSEEQDRALRPSDRRKVVLATNIAETSLTIEGVTTVIDSGLARYASFDAGRGVDRLELGRISRASATQRAGRAGRTRPGRCVRLWSEREERGMAETDVAEVHRVDLSGTLLALHAWGAHPSSFGWFEPPDSSRIEAAGRVLEMLGAVESGRITADGRRLLDIPAPPRVARLLWAANAAGLLRDGAAVAASLAEKDIMTRVDPRSRPDSHAESDVLIRLDRLEEAEAARFDPSLRGRGIDPAVARRVAQARDDYLRVARRWPAAPPPPEGAEDTLMKLLLLAFPDRVCRRRASDPRAGLMVGGRGVRLEADSVVRQGELFLALDPRDDGRGSSREARVRVASLVRAGWLEELFPGSIVREKSARFDEAREAVVGVHVVRYRDLVIAEDQNVALDPDLASKILAQALIPRGLDFLREQESAAGWLARYELLTQSMPEHEWPPLDDAAFAELIQVASQGKRTVPDVRQANWFDLLRGRLTYDQTRLMDHEAPEALVVPSGSRVRLRYEAGKPPVLAVRLQELFGWAETPRVAGGRIPVLLHILGPNYRPVQVTDDLRSFWSQAYFQVRKDLRNRYPKHAWPDDPLSARAEAKGQRRAP
ncbi:MAG TPA: ATP-dependent helicase HrpB [Isosphaeraceae bacterium]